MMKVILKRIRKLHKKFFHNLSPFYGTDDAHLDYTGQSASDLIQNTLASDSPCMICRMGATEMNAVLTYLAIREESSPLSKSIKYIRGEIPCFWWDDKTIYTMSINAGFFSSNDKNLDRFAEMMLSDFQYVDILGSWLRGEKVLLCSNPRAKTVHLTDLEPYHHKEPWSIILQGRRVLVVHPFEESIKQQYAKRTLLFKDTRVLPDFELLTLKAVQSSAGSKVNFADWFEALDWMCQKINNINFDIAIIGAGSYGFPLAAHIKRIGKKAIHLGGATQLLFGIRGARWDKDPVVVQLYNEHWVRPLATEVPQNAQMVEHGCYW